MLLRIAEVFGHSVDNHNAAAREDRSRRWCPFVNAKCNKQSDKDPLGVCSLTDGVSVVPVCPRRFVQDAQIFADVGRMAFGRGRRVVAAPEVHILRITRTTSGGKSTSRRIGKVDFLVTALDGKAQQASDFAALEVQAVYFSGGSIRDDFRHFIRTGILRESAGRRPDWRSSAQKRLMPQLALKVPVFRRWGKRFFVAVDSMFFRQLPRMKTVPAISNSEVVWAVYPFMFDADEIKPGAPEFHYTTWDDVVTALREGVAPEPQEILREIERKRQSKRLPVIST